MVELCNAGDLLLQTFVLEGVHSVCKRDLPSTQQHPSAPIIKQHPRLDIQQHPSPSSTKQHSSLGGTPWPLGSRIESTGDLPSRQHVEGGLVSTANSSSSSSAGSASSHGSKRSSRILLVSETKLTCRQICHYSAHKVTTQPHMTLVGPFSHYTAAARCSQVPAEWRGV